MKVKYQHITNQGNTSFSIEKFDNNRICSHKGLHFHHSYEIVFIKNGKGKIIVDNKSHEYENGALIFLGPCLPHFSFSNNTFDDNYEVVIHFDREFVEKRIKRIPEFSTLIPFIQKSEQVILYNPDFKEKQTAIFEAIVKLSPIEQLASIFNLLCKFSIASNYQYLLAKPLPNFYSNNKQSKVIFDFINENYSNRISTKDVAQHVNMTTNSFCKVFKKLTNKPFVTYLNEYRIHRAVELIENKEDNISEIAFQCGFENLSYFSKIFSQVKNISPRKYKKNYQQQTLK